jgi:FlaA1/EpsC-like NDP-sugar epimerase
MHAMVDYYFNYSSKASQLFAHKKINRAKELFLACGVCLLFYLYHSQWAVAMINRLVLVATTCYIQNFKILLPCFLFSFLCCQRSQNTLDWWLSSCSYHIHCSCRFLYVRYAIDQASHELLLLWDDKLLVGIICLHRSLTSNLRENWEIGILHLQSETSTLVPQNAKIWYQQMFIIGALDHAFFFFLLFFSVPNLIFI